MTVRNLLSALAGIVMSVAGFVVFDTYRSLESTQQAPGLTQNQIQMTTSSEASSLVIGEGDTLDLSGRGLTQVPSDIFSRTEIEKLNLSHNKLTGSLPAEVRHFKNLRVLDLSHNDFTGVPAEVGQLRELQVLDLSYNRLTGLPYELGALVHLEVLDLRGNNYAVADLAVIKRTLPGSVRILVD